MDYYSTLGVAKTATDAEIKTAYRKLAMLHHPDRVSDPKKKAEAEIKFKDINTAYSELSDPSKRSRYDTSGGSSQNPFGAYSNKDREDIYEAMRRAAKKWDTGNGGFRSWNDFGESQFRRPHSTFDDEYDDYWRKKEEDEYEENYENQDIDAEHEITLEEAFSGKEIAISFKDGGKTSTVILNIPRGIPAGKKVRSVGGGSRANRHAPPGDLYVRIKIKEKAGWERVDNDLYHTVNVSVLDLMVGGAVSVHTIDGVELEVQIRAGTQLTATIRIPGRGMSVLGDAKARGDMFLVINPVLPKITDPEAKELVGKLKKLIS